MGEKLTRTQIKNLERFGGVNPADESFSRRQFATQVGGFALAAARPSPEACGFATIGGWKASNLRRQSGSRTTRSNCRSVSQT